MDNTVRQQGSDVQQPSSSLVKGLMFFDRIEKWLARIFEITQEEQTDAGIYYPNDQRYK
jgi:hypothetical protein